MGARIIQDAKKPSHNNFDIWLGDFAPALWALAVVWLMGSAPLLAGQSSPKTVRAGRPASLYNVIDTPNAEVLDYGSFAFTTRFFANGGLLPSIAFGVFQRLMIGASWELDNYIGHGKIDLQRPELQIKFRFFDGDGALPASTVGYDSQGYFYDKSKKEYLQDRRGLYLAFTKEMLAGGLEWTAGGNISDFERDALRGFFNVSWVAPTGGLGAFAEYDNIRNVKWNRLNAGVNLFLSPFIQMGVHIRDILGSGTQNNSSGLRRPERIIDIRYLTSF
ncbi:MAG: hypothetical protein AAB091_06890 [Elusimicrobiota bacterium]